MVSSFDSNAWLDKVVVVTGSNRGIGLAIVESFLKHGATVIACVRNVDSIKLESDNLTVYQLDIQNKENIKELFSMINSKFKRLDVLINNAGIMKDAPMGMITCELVNEVFSTNVYPLFDMIQLSARIMSRNKSGSIINLSSIIGDKGFSGQLVYSASKGAVTSLTKSAAKELASKGIRVNAISPGMVETELISKIDEAKKERLLSKIALGRIGTVNDVAQLALFLASDESSYITGQIIGIDGLMEI